MNLYFSEFDIPEFDRVPVAKARQIWQSCMHNSPMRNFRVAIMVSVLLVSIFWNVPGTWVGAIFVVCMGVSQPLLIVLMRPRIQQAVQNEGII